MIGSSHSGVRPWLLVEASKEGVLRVATAIPSRRPRLLNVREIDISTTPTFTDALQKVGRENDVTLSGTRCTIAMAGATSGEALSLMRSRWTISRAGLAAIFEQPVTVINDVAARAWATRAGTATIVGVRGGGLPSFERLGRMIVLMADEGVGAAVIDIDRDGGVRILETEAGHMEFAPATETEFRLAQALKGTNVSTSWERVLMLDRSDPLWATACPELPEHERPRFLATLLGRLTVNLMTAFAAWNGVMLTGTKVNRILEGGRTPAFESAFPGRRNFSRLVMNTPVWRVDQHEAVLTGSAERLAYELGTELSSVAA
jgi:glucokinase